MEDPVNHYGSNCIDWSIGAMFCHEKPLFKLLKMCKAYGVNHGMKWVFGSPLCVMAGGRVAPVDLNASDAIGIMKDWMNQGLGCRLTFQNPYLTYDDIFQDKKGMELLKAANDMSTKDVQNGVILVSDVLADIVKEKFPNLQVILSTIRAAYEVGYGPKKDTLEWYSNKLNDELYDMVVVSASKCWEEGFFEALPQKEKIEVIASHGCVRNCPRAMRHYDAMLWGSLCHMFNVPGNGSMEQCNRVVEECIRHKKSHPFEESSLNAERISHLTSIGVHHFKIAGRLDNDNDILRDVMEYVFKPEKVRYMLNTID